MKEYRPFFTAAIEKYFPQQADEIGSSVEKTYGMLSDDIGFAFTSKNPMDRRMDFAGYFLSLIKVLDGRAEKEIRKIRQGSGSD